MGFLKMLLKLLPSVSFVLQYCISGPVLTVALSCFDFARNVGLVIKILCFPYDVQTKEMEAIYSDLVLFNLSP